MLLHHEAQRVVVAIHLKERGDGGGDALFTAGFDNTAAVWDGCTFELVRRLAGHEGKVTGVAALGGARIATVSHDRTIKLWGPAEEDAEAAPAPAPAPAPEAMQVG